MSNHTPWYTVRVKELLDPPGNQTVRARRTLIECYVSDLDRATFLFNEFVDVEDPAAEMARLRAVEEAMRHILHRAQTEKRDIHHAPVTLYWIEQEAERALANAAKVGGGA